MREKVMNTIKEQGYQVNMLARGLKGSRTNIIVVFAERHHEEHLSIWHTIMLKHLFTYAKKRSMKIVLSPSSSERFEEDETDGFYLIASGIADGAILLENILQDPRVDYFESHNIPYVVFGEPENPDVPSVSLDNYEMCIRDRLGTVQETAVVEQKIMVPYGLAGTVKEIKAGEFTVEEVVAVLSTKDGDKELTMMQKWPVRKGRPVSYTHLDVYKRQVFYSFGAFHISCFIARCLNIRKIRSVTIFTLVP